MAKRPRRKATLHSAGKVQEADILARARALADDPSLAMPICEGGCVWFSPVAAARRGVLKAHRDRDDEAKLQRRAQRGNDLARAYAATLLIARSEKIPYVADLKVAGEVVPYVIRGKAKPFFLAGLQHHYDRALRLLAVAPWVKKRKLHFFSADRGIVCTGAEPRPPADFIQEETELLDLTSRDGAHVCEHGGAASGRDTLILHWRSAGTRIERCEECIEKDGSTVSQLRRHMAGPKLSDQFEVEATLAPMEARAGAPVAVGGAIPPETARAYTKGTLSDAGLLEAARRARIDALRASGERVLVAGNTSFGDDVDAFLTALTPSPGEERALRVALAAHDGPVVLERSSSARALAELWSAHGRRMLDELADPDLAAKLHKSEVTPDEAADIVRRAAREGSARAALAKFPSYGQLPPKAAAADAIARSHATSGRAAAARVALERAGKGEVAGVVLAFLEALGAAKGQEWRFTHLDREVADSLAPHVRALLEAPPDSYHDALQQLARAAGDTTTFTPQ